MQCNVTNLRSPFPAETLSCALVLLIMKISGGCSKIATTLPVLLAVGDKTLVAIVAVRLIKQGKHSFHYDNLENGRIRYGFVSYSFFARVYLESGSQPPHTPLALGDKYMEGGRPAGKRVNL